MVKKIENRNIDVTKARGELEEDLLEYVYRTWRQDRQITSKDASTVSAADTGILSLTTPLKVYDLVNTAEMVLHQMERMAKKARKPKRRSEREENYIKNAKALLMERNHLTEEEAHRYIQKSSMDNGTNMVETAQMILTLLFEEG